MSARSAPARMTAIVASRDRCTGCGTEFPHAELVYVGGEGIVTSLLCRICWKGPIVTDCKDAAARKCCSGRAAQRERAQA